MTPLDNIKEQIATEGFAIIDDIFTHEEINAILLSISDGDTAKPTFRKTKDLFAIRQFLKEIPGTINKIFTNKFRSIITGIFGNDYFVVKSIYFDKPKQSNWFVAYHQDLTISVDKKIATNGFGPWTVKQNQFAVHPPLNVLQNNFTIRVHLDNTDVNNGALKVIPGSHLKGICKSEAIDWLNEKEVICNVKKGSIMIMRPLLFHSSGRTTNNRQRRVIHIEFSNFQLPSPLQWSELINYDVPRY